MKKLILTCHKTLVAAVEHCIGYLCAKRMHQIMLINRQTSQDGRQKLVFDGIFFWAPIV